MIVDDEESFRVTFADILDARGYDCRSASSVREAISAIDREAADVYLIDLKLPDGNGLEVLARVREVHPSAETIVLTGFSSLATAVQSLNLGAFGYLEKPYNIDRLFITLERALERQRLVRATPVLRDRLFEAVPGQWRGDLRARPAVAPNSARQSGLRRLLGYRPDEVDMLNAGELIPPKLLDRLSSPAALSAPASDASEIVEAPLKRKDGSQHWFSISIVRLIEPPTGDNGNGRVRTGVELLLVCNDMSAARQEVSEMEEHRDFLETVVSAIPSGIAIIDTDYRITYANPAYCRFLELDLDRVLHRRCHEVLSHYQSPCSMFGELCPITAARTNGAVGRVYREFQSADEHRRQVEYSANPFCDGQGNVTSFVVVLNNVSDRRAAESRVAEASEKLGLLNTELSLRQQSSRHRPASSSSRTSSSCA